MVNPQFLFFQASFSYESLALPLAIFVLFVLAVQHTVPAGYRRSLNLLTCGGLAAVVVTHHISSYTLVAFLLLWSALALLQRWRKKGRVQQPHVSPAREALLGLILCLCWLTYTGDIVLGYLAPHLGGTLYQIGQILRGESASRQLFQNSSGYVEPVWERVVALASEVLVMLVLPLGLFQIWLRYRGNVIALALSVGALAYPVSQALRLTPAGAESGVRSTEFLFLGISFVMAIGIAQFQLFRRSSRKQSILLLSSLAIVIVGQVVSGGSPAWARMPGPYLVSADQRSIVPDSISAAEWAGSHLGAGRRIASDRINTLLLATYGDEVTFTSVSEKVPVRPLFIAPEFGFAEQTILQQDHIQYLVVDHRLSTTLPWAGAYFDDQETNNGPIDPAALAKFDAVNDVSRLFDSGNIVIYDVEAIAG
jgi:heme A synthase